MENTDATRGTQEALGDATITTVKAPRVGDKADIAMELKSNSTKTARVELLLDNPCPSGKIDINYSICVNNLAANMKHVPRIADSRGQKTCRAFPIQFTTDGNIQYMDGDSSYTTLQTYDKGTWYDISLKLDIENQTYDLYINGEAAKTGLKLPTLKGVALTNVQAINYQIASSGTETSSVLIDNLSVVNVASGGAATIPTGTRGNDQDREPKCVITRFDSKEKGALAITDMLNAYSSWASSAERGVMLTDNRGAFVVRDEITLKSEKADIYWFAHTLLENAIEVSQDGKSAIITDPKGNRMWVGILSDEGTFTVRDCEPLEGSPDPEGQADNSATYHKLTILFEGVTAMDVTVAYIPLPRDTSVTVPENLDKVRELSAGNLADWQIPDGEIPSVDTLTVGGVEIEGFTPTKTNYTVTIRNDQFVNGNIPPVVATKDGVNLEVTQATLETPTASFVVTEGDTSTKFTINFIVRYVIGREVQGYYITEDNLTYSSEPQPENPARAVLDGDLDTRWASQGTEEWMIIDFGQARSFEKLAIAMYNSAARTYRLEILVSKDGTDYTSVYNGPDMDVYKDGEHQGPVDYDFGGTYQARYIKIIFKGYDEYKKQIWNNVAEIQ